MSAPAVATPRAARALIALAALFVVAFALGVSFGTVPVSFSRALSDPDALDRVYLAVRVPRVALGAIAGAGLAIVGAAFQAVLRNPLAEPFVLGVSGGAALGATCALLLGLAGATLLGASVVPLAALAGGLAATALVYALAGAARGRGALASASMSTNILLAGVVVNAIAAAAITLLKTLVSASKAQELLFWLVGFVDLRPTTELVMVAVYVALGAALLVRDAGRLNLLALGDESAAHLGVDVRALERRVFIASSLVVGAIVSVTGLIGFVGLMVPHALRRVLGPDNRVLLPASLFAGGATLIVCDLATRVLFRWVGRELPVGAVTALVGGPVFLVLLRRR